MFNGNVVVAQGTMAIRAERVEVRERADGHRSATALGSGGKPASFKQKRDGVDETIEGVAERIEYDSRGDVVRFAGNAQVRRLRGGDAGRRDQRRRDHLRQRQRDLQRAGRAPSAQPGAASGRATAASRGHHAAAEKPDALRPRRDERRSRRQRRVSALPAAPRAPAASKRAA